MDQDEPITSTNKTLVTGIITTVTGTLLISLVTGALTYRDMVSQNEFNLHQLQSNQAKILAEVQMVNTLVNGLNANYQALKQDDLDNQRDISRLYQEVDELKGRLNPTDVRSKSW